MFSKQRLKSLLLPLVIEQILAVLVGMIDTVMVASLGEAVVSGVSLVDGVNILLINIFAALATGGAVVVSQYLGHEDQEHARFSAKQLILITGIISIVIMVISLSLNEWILITLFGQVEETVMKSAKTYFYLSALSYPFIALYNAGAALFRAQGNSKVSMVSSLIMNGMNFVGNYILIFVIPMGVFGAALSTLIARFVCCFIVLYLVTDEHNAVHIDSYFKLGFNKNIVSKILSIGIPNALENGMFQFGKIMVQGLIASFGTSAIAANAVANNFASLEVIPGAAIGLGMVTIVGQCVGAKEYKQAESYTKKLLFYAYGAMIALNIFIFAFAKNLIGFYNLSTETADVAYILLMIHGVMGCLIWPLSFTLPNALRAAGDAKFTMSISVVSMWLCRVGLSYVLGLYFQLGVVGVWISMTIDWCFRASFFMYRFLSGKWKNRVLV